MQPNLMAHFNVLPSSNWVNPVRLGELFCGAGGMALGASQASYAGWCFDHVWVTDRDRDGCRTIGQIVPLERIYQQSVEDIDFRQMPAIDGLVFGFPCNDFSMAGDRDGINGKHGGLYKFGVKALDVLNPGFFVAENVSGLASSNNKRDFVRILDELRNAGQGYVVVDNLYKFEEYGVPQKRHRYIIVGFRSDLGVHFEHPSPTGETKTAGQALEGIDANAYNNEMSAQKPRVTERLSYIKPGQNVFNADMPSELRLQIRTNVKMSYMYRKLVASEPAYTVTGSGGGGTRMYHWNENRALTNRERARLQTFPDWYKFEGGRESVRRQIGMAVPPDAARIVFESVLAVIAGTGHLPSLS